MRKGKKKKKNVNDKTTFIACSPSSTNITSIQNQTHGSGDSTVQKGRGSETNIHNVLSLGLSNVNKNVIQLHTHLNFGGETDDSCNFMPYDMEWSEL